MIPVGTYRGEMPNPMLSLVLAQVLAQSIGSLRKVIVFGVKHCFLVIHYALADQIAERCHGWAIRVKVLLKGFKNTRKIAEFADAGNTLFLNGFPLLNVVRLLFVGRRRKEGFSCVVLFLQHMKVWFLIPFLIASA